MWKFLLVSWGIVWYICTREKRIYAERFFHLFFSFAFLVPKELYNSNFILPYLISLFVTSNFVLPYLISLFVFLLCIFPQSNFNISTDYGRPMKPFFIEIQNCWAWADKLAFGVFCPNYQHPFWYSESHVFHYSTIISTKNQPFISTSQIFIWDWHLNLGRKELGI